MTVAVTATVTVCKDGCIRAWRRNASARTPFGGHGKRPLITRIGSGRTVTVPLTVTLTVAVTVTLTVCIHNHNHKINPPKPPLKGGLGGGAAGMLQSN